MSYREQRIAVVMGGKSRERDVSLQTGAAVDAALVRRGYHTVQLDMDRELPARLVQESVGAAFIALHGRYGEDGCVQGLLETLEIPYTGSGVRSSALCMDKVLCKTLFADAGIPTAPWCSPVTDEAAAELGWPLVVKPRCEGSTVGLSIVKEAAALSQAIETAGGAEQAMAEPLLEGREIAVGVLGSGEMARCLGTVEIRPAEGLYDYQAKYERDDTEYLAPAPVPAAVLMELSEQAVRIHRLLGCSGATRSDFIWREGRPPQVLEINTIPGMTGHSLLPMVAKLAGMSFDDLAEAILNDASLKG